MEDDQQFCLRWNNHQSTLIQNFDTLLESGTLVDCTLAAEGKTLKAHKVVLSACSPYFECLLSEHYDKHPVFILKDVKFKELKAMMDYMYRGEVNISQDQLAALLKAAESLQIKGLSESKTAGSSKTESRAQKTISQPIARVSPSLDIPHASSGLTIEKNKVPRQSVAQGPVADLPEDTASPQGSSKRLCSREGSQSPTSRKRTRFRRRSLGEDNNTLEMQDASNSSDMPQQMGVPALGIAPVTDEKVHADSIDSLGRSALMTQLTKPADEILQPLEKSETNDNLIEPKSEYLEESEECVEDLTLDDDMNDLNDVEQDNNRAGPSHDPTQHPASLGAWHVTGDRSNAGGVVDSLRGGGTDEVFLAAQEAAQQAQRDSQEGERPVMKKKRPRKKDDEVLLEREKEECRKIKRSNLTNGKTAMPGPATLDPATPGPSTSTEGRSSKISEVITLSDSQNESSDDDSSSPWTNSKNIKKPKCPYCGVKYEKRHNLIKHITLTCLKNVDSKANKEAGKFRCKDCGRNYGKMKALRWHQKHECQHWVTCPDCGKTMRGTYITERHKQKYCVKQRSRIQHTKIKIKQEDSPDELFIDESSIEF